MGRVANRATQLVYWKWTAPDGGQVRVDSCGSGFDSIVGVVRREDGDWAGGTSDSDGCGDDGDVTMTVEPGREYWIGVGGKASSSGAIALHLAFTPDHTPPVTTIHGPAGTWQRWVGEFTWSVADAGATTSQCSFDDWPWWQCQGSESFEESQFTEGERVFRVRSTDQFGNEESAGAERRFIVSIPEAPNDDFADALALVPDQPVAVNNGKATAEPGEPSHDSWYYEQGLSADFSVWFTFTPQHDGVSRLDWCGSAMSAVMAVYTGSAVGELQRVANRDEGCSDSFTVHGGVTYRVALDGLARNRS